MLERFLNAHVRVGVDVADAFIVDDEQRVHVLAHLLHTLQRLYDFQTLLEEEGDGDHADGQQTHRLGYACDERGGTGSGSASHARCDEHHLRAVAEHLLYLVRVFACFLKADGRIAAGSEFAERNLHGHFRLGKCLCVSVTDGERNIDDTFLVHVADGVTSAAAYSDNLNDVLRLVFHFVGKVNKGRCVCYFIVCIHLCLCFRFSCFLFYA